MTRQNCLGILWRNPHHRIRRIDVTVTQCASIAPRCSGATNADCRFMRTRMALGSELEGPRLGHENIATRPLGHPPKAREVQMHPADQ